MTNEATCKPSLQVELLSDTQELVEWLRSLDMSGTDRAADLIETQAREIEQMREALVEIMERGGAFGGIWCALAAQEALAGDSHDQ